MQQSNAALALYFQGSGLSVGPFHLAQHLPQVIGNAYTQTAKLLFAGVLPMHISLTIYDNFPFFIPSPTLDLVTPLNVC